MLYKITGEQPFQVNSTSFSVSPSESGYNLYISADGINYSPFLTVPSGVTKQMVDMNNGNYYRLMGNTSEVTVNWERDCGRGGGGVAGVSSLDGQTGALTTKTINGNSILGSGDIVITGGTGSGSSVSYEQILSAGTEIGQITIDGSATTIYAPAGGSEIVQNYQIVSALTDVEGEEGVTTLSGFTMNFSAVTKNTYVGGSTSDWETEYFNIADAIEAMPDIQMDTPGFYLYDADMSNLVQIADDDTWHTWEHPSGGSYLYKRNGYDIDILFAQYPEDVLLTIVDLATWEESNEVATGDTASTVTAIVIKEGTVAYLTTDGKFYQYLSNNWSEAIPIASNSTLGGIKVGSGLTIDANGILSVSGGSSSGPTIIDFDSMSQQERADLFTVIYDKYTGTTDGINNEYTFYKTFNNWTPENQKDRKYRVQFALGDNSRLLFSYVSAHMDYGNYAHSWRAWLNSDGSMSTEDADIKGLTADVSIAKTYFQGGYADYTLTFNKATSAFTADNGGSSFPVTAEALDAILYWAGFHNGANVEGPTVIRLKFNVIDNGETTSYYFPSLSCKSITPVTIGDYTYNEEGGVNYGSFTVKFLMENTRPMFTNLTFIENY